jgi:hypothetical protein
LTVLVCIWIFASIRSETPRCIDSRSIIYVQPIIAVFKQKFNTQYQRGEFKCCLPPWWFRLFGTQFPRTVDVIDVPTLRWKAVRDPSEVAQNHLCACTRVIDDLTALTVLNFTVTSRESGITSAKTESSANSATVACFCFDCIRIQVLPREWRADHLRCLTWKLQRGWNGRDRACCLRVRTVEQSSKQDCCPKATFTRRHSVDVWLDPGMIIR